MNTPDFTPFNSYVQPEPETDDQRERAAEDSGEFPPLDFRTLFIASAIVGAAILASLAWPNWITP